MRRHKRNPAQRSYIKGYQAAISGRTQESCPYQHGTTPSEHWMRGWLEGREDQQSGYNTMTLQQKVGNL